VATYALSHEQVRRRHWAEGGVAGDGTFNAHFSPHAIMIGTPHPNVPGHGQHRGRAREPQGGSK